MNVIGLDETKPFLRAARRYCSFIETTTKSDTEFLEELEGVLLDLYKTATTLRSPTLLHEKDFEHEVSTDGLDSILHRIGARIGGNSVYWEVFEPFDHDNHDPVCGDLVDDLGDIYRDIKRALVIFDLDTAAAKDDAMWQLKFGFENHWGRHALGALMAIHHLLRRS
jgi:hypothetical protein